MLTGKTKDSSAIILLIAFLLAVPPFSFATATTSGNYTYTIADQICRSGPEGWEVTPEEEELIERGELVILGPGDLEGPCNGDGITPSWGDTEACCGQICEVYKNGYCELKEEYQAFLDKSIVEKYVNQKRTIEEKDNEIADKEQEIESLNNQIASQRLSQEQEIGQLTEKFNLIQTAMVVLILILVISLISNLLLIKKKK